MSTRKPGTPPPSGMQPGANFRFVQPGPARLMESIERLLGSDRRRAERFMRFARDSRMSLEHIWCAIDEKDRIISTVLASPSPGRTALLFSSSPDTPGEAREIGRLIDATCNSLKAAGMGLAQSLVEPGEQLEHTAFLEGGLEELAILTYMERPVPARGSDFDTELPGDLTIEPFTLDQREELEALLPMTYQETLDCPGLAGLRDPKDVVDGHMSAGIFKPEWWLIARDAGRPIGVILLNGSSGSSSVELVYLGIIPESRGSGLGQRLLNNGLQRIAGTRERKVVLAVDEANTPALGIYEKTGFKRTVRRCALIRSLDRDEPLGDRS